MDKSIDDILILSVGKSIWHRLPWLVIGLAGGLVAAGIVEVFESTLKDNLILAAFIPLIVYISDAVGTQMEAFIVRDSAIHPRLNFKKYFWKQLTVVGIIGIVLAALLLFFSFVIYKDFRISFVLSLSLFVAVISSIFTGLVVPNFFKRLKLDPANASGPIATIIQDVVSVFIFFAIASFLL
jgi:magnesium transporter